MYPMILSEDTEDDVAFKILNKDNLSISNLYTTILQPFDVDQQKKKPNGIVYPIRRTDIAFEQNIDERPKTLLSIETKSQAIFNRTLDNKLRKLQKEDRSSRKNKTNSVRKPFITTVKKGQFLEPPPEIASLIGIGAVELEQPKKEEKKLYAYASKPRILNRTKTSIHKAKCGASVKSDEDQEDEHGARRNRGKRSINDDFPQERKLAKGANCDAANDHMPRWNPNFAYAKLLSQDQGNADSTSRADEMKRRALARKKAISKQYHRSSQQSLRSSTPSKIHQLIQTDTHFEKILTHSFTQIEKCALSPVYISLNKKEDVETQICPDDFDYDGEIGSTVEFLVGKTVEEALIEVLEEEELAALREQQRRMMEMKSSEESLEEFDGIEMDQRAPTSVQVQHYVAEQVPEILDEFAGDPNIMNNFQEDMDESFVSWLVKETTDELLGIVSNKDVLSDIVREILENRIELMEASKGLSENEGNGEQTGDEVVKGNLVLENELLTENVK